MGNKTRTRRTKWRRLSLGDASGPEEEDDETQPQEQQEPEELRQNVVVLPSDEKEQSVCVEHDKKSKFASAVVVTTTVNNNNNNSTAAASSDGVANSASSGREEEQTKSAMMVSNHSNQRGPAWKLPASNSQPVKNGYYNVNNGYQSNSGRPTGGSSNAPSAANGFRRANNGPSARYNSFNGTYGNNGYGRANSWNNGSSNGYANADHHHHHGAPGLSKMHGIEKKIFNDEEYTKISTPRQEVLFKKGSIGAKKKLSTTTSAPPVGSSVHADSEQDSLNGNAASPVSPSQGDSADPFQYSGVIFVEELRGTKNRTLLFSSKSWCSKMVSFLKEEFAEAHYVKWAEWRYCLVPSNCIDDDSPTPTPLPTWTGPWENCVGIMNVPEHLR
ncbi:hypothetical protein OUZ56_027232 [Daphnia magna]|uniref:Uncharacterized protein n=1 Tax=Daphnia magna TaxID=35525 RepID=A0ABQ9ZP60_9CRUS|nr:hypothetical protein OUZ56_027232 [Daphnia magna]